MEQSSTDERPPWDTDTAWQLLRELKHRGPDRDGVRRVERAPGSLAVQPNGDWSCHNARLHPGADALLAQLIPATAAPGAPYAIGQIAQTLDGRTATAGGRGDRLSSGADQLRLHRLRALVDAVIIGAETALADHPRLTVRHVTGEHPRRIVLDRSRRLAPDHPLLCDGASSALRLVAERHSGDGDNVVAVPRMDPTGILRALAERQLPRVLIEGGGQTVSRFLRAGCLDRLHLVIAPLLVGSGPPGIDLPPIADMARALRPAHRQFQLGSDVLFDLDLGDIPAWDDAAPDAAR